MFLDSTPGGVPPPAGVTPTHDSDQGAASAVLRKICSHPYRDSLPYMDVARAMVMLARLERGPKASRELCDRLEISRQTRCNWLKPEQAASWVGGWQHRFEALGRRTQPGSAPTMAKPRYSEDDWKWIASLLQNRNLWSLPEKQRIVRTAARQSVERGELPSRSHLINIHFTTLWRRRQRLSGLVTAAQNAALSAGPVIDA